MESTMQMDLRSHCNSMQQRQNYSGLRLPWSVIYPLNTTLSVDTFNVLEIFFSSTLKKIFIRLSDSLFLSS